MSEQPLDTAPANDNSTELGSGDLPLVPDLMPAQDVKGALHLTEVEIVPVTHTEGLLFLQAGEVPFACYLNASGAKKLMRAAQSFLEENNPLFNEDGTFREEPMNEMPPADCSGAA